MADQIAPPTSNAPLTAEDAAIIRAEKQLDEDTRDRLAQVYGESKMALGKRIAMRRPARQAWRCPACGQTSDDIRGVCGNCLAPESSQGGKQWRGNAKAVTLTPGSTDDADTQLRTITATGRTYRQFNDPIGQPKEPAAAGAELEEKALREQRTGGEHDIPRAARNGASERADMYDDEPDCGDADGGSHRPGDASRREMEEEASSGDDHRSGIGGSSPAGGPPQASSLNKEKRIPPERGSPFTHFVSLPIGKLPAVAASAEALLSSLRGYVEAVALQEAGAKDGSETTHTDGDKRAGKDDAPATHLTLDLVTKAPKMHVTLLLLSLSTPKDVGFAKELLNIFAQRWAKESGAEKEGGGVDVRFSGLRVMPERDGGRRGSDAKKASGARVNPKKASVVYMGLRDEASTQRVSHLQAVLHECFKELISEENREEVERTKVNLHMTVMNKKWRKRGAKRPFDATGILQAFGDSIVCGVDSEDEGIRVPCVELNRMSGHDGKASTYFVEASVPI